MQELEEESIPLGFSMYRFSVSKVTLFKKAKRRVK